MSGHFSRRTSSESTFTTPDVSTGFSRLDLAVAKVVVRKLIKAGVRKGPSDLLVIEDLAYEQWLEEEAVVYLREQKARRQAVVAEIR